MTKVSVHPSIFGGIQEVCVEMGGHPVQGLIVAASDGFIDLTSANLVVLKDYFAHVEDYLASKYPGHDPHSKDYDPADEDAFLDAIDLCRNHLVMRIADEIGDDFLTRT